jgi:hypothetical protein
MALAIPKAVLHNRAFRALTEGLTEEHKEQVMKWEADVREWEQDHTKDCPYDYPEDEGVQIHILPLPY